MKWNLCQVCIHDIPTDSWANVRDNIIAEKKVEFSTLSPIRSCMFDAYDYSNKYMDVSSSVIKDYLKTPI